MPDDQEPSADEWQQLRDDQPQWLKDGNGLGAPPLLDVTFKTYQDELPVVTQPSPIDEPQELGGAAFDGPGGQDDGEGEWYALTLCDGTALEVWARNIVPP